MTAQHEAWVKSWAQAQAEVRALPRKNHGVALFRIVWKKKVMNSLGKARSRARSHLAGAGHRNDAIVDITLAAEERPGVKTMSLAAKQVAKSAGEILTKRHFSWEPLQETTPDGVAYLGVRLLSIWPQQPQANVSGSSEADLCRN